MWDRGVVGLVGCAEGPLAVLHDLAGLLDVLSLCLGGEQLREVGHLDLLKDNCSSL